jgi:hypothetical protein
MPSLLGALSPEEFLERYWQKAPLFVPKALPGYTSPISPDELAGLACEANVESRLVHSSSKAEYQLEFGPFEEARFPRLGKANWTLLVQDVDDRSLFCCMADWQDPQDLKRFLESPTFGALKGAAQVLGGIEEIVVLENGQPGRGDWIWPQLS